MQKTENPEALVSMPSYGYGRTSEAEEICAASPLGMVTSALLPVVKLGPSRHLNFEQNLAAAAATAAVVAGAAEV